MQIYICNLLNVLNIFFYLLIHYFPPTLLNRVLINSAEAINQTEKTKVIREGINYVSEYPSRSR